MKEAEKEKNVKIVKKACPICYGMGVCERPNGDTYDCPGRSCKGGYIEIKTFEKGK